MANTDTPFGFRPVNALGQSYVSRVSIYFKAAADTQAIFIGDAVTTTGTAHTDEHSTPIVEQADTTDAIRGVCVGVLHENPNDLTKVFSPASTGQYIYVADDPDQLFEIQEDSDTATLAAVDTGLNIDIIVGTGSTQTGFSAMEIDSDSGEKGTATAQLRLLRISPRINNELGANAKWIVKINEHELSSTTGL
jgi:hypothetical protein